MTSPILSLLKGKLYPNWESQSPKVNRRNLLQVLSIVPMLMLGSTQLIAQLDTLHYIPPFGTDNGDNEEPGDVHLYISTPSATPVNFTLTDAGGVNTYLTGTVVSGTTVRSNSSLKILPTLLLLPVRRT